MVNSMDVKIHNGSYLNQGCNQSRRLYPIPSQTCCSLELSSLSVNNFNFIQVLLVFAKLCTCLYINFSMINRNRKYKLNEFRRPLTLIISQPSTNQEKQIEREKNKKNKTPIRRFHFLDKNQYYPYNQLSIIISPCVLVS